MYQRGLAAKQKAPRGVMARSQRALPRRAAPAAVHRRRRARLFVPAEQKQRVVALGGGRFRVITTIINTIEHVVDAEELARLGLKPPEAELPWQPEPSFEHEQRARRRDTPEPLGPKPETVALRYWVEHVKGGDDVRIRSALPAWIDKHGPDGVREAMDVVARERPKASFGAKFFHLVKTLRRPRTE